MNKKFFVRRALPAATFLAALAAMPAQAATVTFDYNVSFGAVSPDGPAPWATSVFDDGGGSGSVTLTMSVAAGVNLADVTQMYFNLDPSIDPTSLTFARDGGTGPTAANTSIQTGTDNFQADGDGRYDILFDFPRPRASRLHASTRVRISFTPSRVQASLPIPLISSPRRPVDSARTFRSRDSRTPDRRKRAVIGSARYRFQPLSGCSAPAC